VQAYGPFSNCQLPMTGSGVASFGVTGLCVIVEVTVVTGADVDSVVGGDGTGHAAEEHVVAVVTCCGSAVPAGWLLKHPAAITNGIITKIRIVAVAYFMYFWYIGVSTHMYFNYTACDFGSSDNAEISMSSDGFGILKYSSMISSEQS